MKNSDPKETGCRRVNKDPILSKIWDFATPHSFDSLSE